MSAEEESSLITCPTAPSLGAGSNTISDDYQEEIPEADVNLFSDNNDGVEKDKSAEPPLDNQLDMFREQWKNELHDSPKQSPREQPKATPGLDQVEEEAKSFYLKGIELEENHMLMEAIYYYKRALHLMPDIETKLAPFLTQSPIDRVRQDSECSLEESEDLEENLVIHFENLSVYKSALCRPAYEQRATHISVLPVELLMYILQWVVSTNLDLRSLENFSQVCRGFYLCARDEKIWKIACDKVWGANAGSAKKFGGSWRRMMIERPHPLFDGCYISRVTYIRQGEQNMDQFYRPCHIVQYFRYMRFFPDGSALMLVSPEDPSQSLPKIRSTSSRAAGLLVGGYKLKDSKVVCVLKRVNGEKNTVFRYKRQRRAAAAQNETDISYYAEFEMSSAVKRPNAKLSWVKYSTCTFNKSTGEETVSNFDLPKASFPVLIFSHVGSFCSVPSDEPLM